MKPTAKNPWPLDQQFQPHRPKVTKEIAQGRVLGLNPFGKLEGFYHYAKDQAEIEVTIDLDFQKVVVGDEERVVVVGANLLCPRCNQALYVRGRTQENGYNIEVHFDRMTQSDIDKRYRPPVTIEGVISCDYSWNEINGIVGPRAINKCGWRGVIERGRATDAQLIRTAR